jgi:hypothetical protein
MNANAETNIAPTTVDIEKRIADERNRLNAELGLQNRLQAQQMPALESGDHDALELIEKNLSSCIDRQYSIENRIRLLTDRLEQSKQRDESERLDQLAANAERARERGEKIIANIYPKLAKQLSAALTELAECESIIDSANGQLRAGGRFELPSADRERMTTAPFQNTLRPLHLSVVLPSERGDGTEYWSEGQTHTTARKNVAKQGFALAQMQALRAKYGSKWRDTDEGRELLTQ